MRIRPLVVSVAAWTVGAAVSVVVGLVALSAIGAGLADGPMRPLAPNALSQPEQADSSPTPFVSAAPSLNPAATTPGAGTPAGNPQTDRTVSSRGGTVVVSCRTSGTYLVGWSPAPGYRADDPVRGPAPTASVTFASRDNEVKIAVRCVNGIAQPTIDDGHDDDHSE